MDSATLNSYVGAALIANGLRVSDDEKSRISNQFSLILAHADLIKDARLSADPEQRK